MKKNVNIQNREASIEDVAKLAGVSCASVSRVINRLGNVSAKTEAKVRSAIEQLHYQPNSFKTLLNLGLVEII